MQRSVLRSSARLLLQQPFRRSVSSTRVLASNNNRSKWVAVGLTTIGTVGFLMMSNPIMADSEGKKSPKEAKGAKVVTKEEKTSDETSTKKEDEKDQVESAEGDGEQEEQGQQAAYDPVTGQINWDCPCLGGMADGPCGEEFKEAFSCFVYSELEPKGIDCIEKFKNMQNCFRKYPEVYSEELRDDDDNVETDAQTSFPEGEEEIVVTVVEDDQGNVIADEVAVTEVVGDSFTFEDKVSIDLKDVDEFIKDEPNQN